MEDGIHLFLMLRLLQVVADSLVLNPSQIETRDVFMNDSLFIRPASEDDAYIWTIHKPLNFLNNTRDNRKLIDFCVGDFVQPIQE